MTTHDSPGGRDTTSGDGGASVRKDVSESPPKGSASSVSLPVIGGGAPRARALSTLEADGTRHWLRPSLAKGSLWRRRRIVGFVLIAIFVAIPHLRIGGRPLVQLDIAAREFTFFGHAFLPSDTLLLALAMIGVFLTVVLATALAGRVWCGWGCPQTVYMEFVFRPIDRWFEGTSGRGGKPRRKPTGVMAVLRFLTYLALSMFLAHTFLAYFVGTEKLSLWIRSSPLEHPTAFLVMAGTTVAMLYDFMFFREQMCTIACPYGRFQSVMLDRSSLIVGYDVNRGEPRGKRVNKKRQRAKPTRGPAGTPSADTTSEVVALPAEPTALQPTAAEPTTGNGVVPSGESPAGDCVDCGRCVTVCPTGIDIREGLQMECINCTQCIDACDDVMEKLGRPKRLIGYTSQEQLDGESGGMLRARTVLYPLLLLAVTIAFVVVLSSKYAFDARIVRGKGQPYNQAGAGRLSNSLSVRIVNRSEQAQTYTIAIREPEDVELRVLAPEQLSLDHRASELVPVLIEFPTRITQETGTASAEIVITDSTGTTRTVDFRLVGPQR